MPRQTELSPTAQTAYAQVLDAALAYNASRTVASLSGSFSSKRVSGHEYWYFQHVDGTGHQRQVYLGPASARLEALIAAKAAGSQGAETIRRLAHSAAALGCTTTPSGPMRAIKRLADGGLFHAGGVMVGTHAFLAMGNMLGVAWGDTTQTQDIDFAHAGRSLAVALPTNVKMDAADALASLEAGWLPLPGASGKPGGSWLSRKHPDMQVDFITPRHRGADKKSQQLGVVMCQLKFMEYLLVDVQQAAVFGAPGVCVASVPSPARYAMHKLIVSGERPPSAATKSAKDIRQAAALIEVIAARAPWQLHEAWHDLCGRGPGWRARAQRALATLSVAAPDLNNAVRGFSATSMRNRKGVMI